MIITIAQLVQLVSLQPRRSQPVPRLKQSAVMMILKGENGNDDRFTHLVLIMKAKDGSRHSGQMAFPGGVLDNERESPQDAALRETEEEIGIAAPNLNVLGSLGYFSTMTTGFDASVVVAVPATALHYRLQVAEVAAVFEIPLAELWRQFDPRWRFNTPVDFLNLHFHVAAPPHLKIATVDWVRERQMVCVWGFTARVLDNFFRAWHALST